MKLSPTCDQCGAELWHGPGSLVGCKPCFERFGETKDYCRRCAPAHGDHVAKRAREEGWLSVQPQAPPIPKL